MGYIQKLTGFITQVGDITFVGSSNTPKQLIVLHIPAYEYQGYSIPEEHWEIELFGMTVEKYNIHERAVGEKAEIKFSATSKGWFSPDKGKTFYNVTNRLKDIAWLGATVGGVAVPASARKTDPGAYVPLTPEEQAAYDAAPKNPDGSLKSEEDDLPF